MKRKVLSILFALVLVLSLSLIPVTPAMANSVASSIMHFEGVLTPSGDGYTGVINMTAGEYYVTGGGGEAISTAGGFDVYAKEGGEAYVEGMDPDTWTIGSDHDAYSEAGPWGSWYDPDCEDWIQYSLELTADHWYLRYTATGESPMSGTIVWNGDGTGYATESDTGTVRNDDGSNPTDPLNRDATRYAAGSAQEWGWHCGWGEERIPLEYPGFEVVVTGDNHVTLTPSASSSTVNVMVNTAGIIGIRVMPTSIDFGTLYPGQSSPKTTIIITNIGTEPCDVAAYLDQPNTVFDNLSLKGSLLDEWGVPLGVLGDEITYAQLAVPQNYSPLGTETNILIFEATTTP